MKRATPRAFTTAEVVIALVIIAILLLIAIPQFTRPSLAAVSAPDSAVAPNGAARIAVRVSNARGTPQRGVTVRFDAVGRGTVDSVETSTDSTGVASTSWRATADTGDATITVHAAGRTSPELVITRHVRGTPVAAAPTAPPTSASTAPVSATPAATAPPATSPAASATKKP